MCNNVSCLLQVRSLAQDRVLKLGHFGLGSWWTEQKQPIVLGNGTLCVLRFHYKCSTAGAINIIMCRFVTSDDDLDNTD
jgi:hypothetical protein